MTQTRAEIRKAIFKVLKTDPTFYVYGCSPKAKLATSKLSINLNHIRPEGVVFCCGVDWNLPDNERRAIWLAEGTRAMDLLEEAGFKLDREIFGSKDGRAFMIITGGRHEA